MNKYVVKIKGHQYLVKKGDKITVDKLEVEEGKTLEFDEVLLSSDGKKTTVGTPLVKDAKIKAKIIKHKKGKKLEIVKFRKKNRYLKRGGHRQQYTEIEIM